MSNKSDLEEEKLRIRDYIRKLSHIRRKQAALFAKIDEILAEERKKEIRGRINK